MLYYEHAYKAQDFVDQWLAYLKLPILKVKLCGKNSNYRAKGAICVEESTIILWEKNIKNREQFVLVLLHELSHWWLYWNHSDDRYKDEEATISLSHIFLKDFYPTYWRRKGKN